MFFGSFLFRYLFTHSIKKNMGCYSIRILLRSKLKKTFPLRALPGKIKERKKSNVYSNWIVGLEVEHWTWFLKLQSSGSESWWGFSGTLPRFSVCKIWRHFCWSCRRSKARQTQAGLEPTSKSRSGRLNDLYRATIYETYLHISVFYCWFICSVKILLYSNLIWAV